MYLCTYVYMYICIYTHRYTYTCIHVFMCVEWRETGIQGASEQAREQAKEEGSKGERKRLRDIEGDAYDGAHRKKERVCRYHA